MSDISFAFLYFHTVARRPTVHACIETSITKDGLILELARSKQATLMSSPGLAFRTP